MLKDILKTTAKLKKDIEYKILSDSTCIERELLISIHCQLEDIERKISKGVSPQLAKFYEDHPTDNNDNLKVVSPEPYYMKTPKLYGNGKVKLHQGLIEFNNITDKSKEDMLEENIKKIPNFVPYEVKIPTIKQPPKNK